MLILVLILLILVICLSGVLLARQLRWFGPRKIERVIVYTPHAQIAGLLVHRRGEFLKLAEPVVLVGQDPPTIDGMIWVPKDIVMWMQVRN